ncbi:DUF86 domain-containing protein [Paenibacillus sp. NEAU-GSW1]|uniref:DUF86 domain-containing protein n=1 Tax=Paenibacillus sp. NEAU-GSW1 TaxID=2682486 RepID=UPI0012E2BD69|nr:HepT-like ribonuclease domain-containing protein [Paenibacillus sp. NEAU-GSW1]MUT66896.1 DUF86 domain-containing protein [Paenibacillus sp. NEAU-GSW1]
MYYVNREQIGVRLEAMPDIAQALNTLADSWQGSLIEGMAQERALHLAIEIITDVGSYLIDGFIMRDASSYEDIIEITGEEGVFPNELKQTFIELVQLRKPLVQDYFTWQRAELYPQIRELSEQLLLFKASVEQYIERELNF